MLLSDIDVGGLAGNFPEINKLHKLQTM